MTKSEQRAIVATGIMGWKMYDCATDFPIWCYPNANKQCYVADYHPDLKDDRSLGQAFALLVKLESLGFEIELGKGRRCGDRENPAWARINRVKDQLIVDQAEGKGRWPSAALLDACAKLANELAKRVK